MKSGLIGLFSFLIICISYSNAVKFDDKFEKVGYSTVSQSFGNHNTKLEEVISSRKTPLVLKSTNYKKYVKDNRFEGYKSVKYTENSKNKNFIGNRNLEKTGKKLDNFESPVIRKSGSKSNINSKDPSIGEIDIDTQNRINNASTQTVSGREAFSAIYPDPKGFSEDVKVKIIDPNYEDVKESFYGKLNKILDDKLLEPSLKDVSNATKKLKLAVDINSKDFKNIDPEVLDSNKKKLDDKAKTTEFTPY